MNGFNHICHGATEFLKKFFRIYLEDRNFPQTITMLHPQISWVGTGAHEVCRCHEDAVRLMTAEQHSWNGRFKILEEWYHPLPISETTCAVFGQLKLSEDGLSTVLIDMDSRFSALCVLEDGKFTLYHAHFSVADAAQAEDEFVHKTVIENYNRLLEEKFLERTQLLKEREEALRLSQKRYEVALSASEITMFEYDILTKDLIFYDDVSSMYNVPNIVENGVETFISRRIIEPDSVPAYREMYRKIHAGEASASCHVNTRDADDVIHDFELTLTTVYDDNGTPIRAIGVRKNVSILRQLEREREYGKTLVSDKSLLFEADITADTILFVDASWGKTINATEGMKFFQTFTKVTTNFIEPEHCNIILNSCSREYIETQYAAGISLLSFSYRLKVREGEFTWYEATINIIKNQHTGHLNIRFYNMDITDRKIKEEKAQDEQRLYETMLSRAIVAYEVNITKNLAIKGHESWNALFGIQSCDDYSAMITSFAEKGAHADDGSRFAATFNRDSVLAAFHNGHRHLICQYRKKSSGNEYQWVSCTLHLFEDPITGDVKGFSYVEDIDDQKRAELALKYDAEHDKMTGLYNKATTETLIREFLETASAKADTHAFIMIDVDHFKYVNDCFGHPFGDDVLAEIAKKIHSTFREQDVVGRIGGDEFCVFMKNIPSSNVVCAKANEICAKVLRTYGQNGKAATVSVSVGIAISNVHGHDYPSLYRYADTALYAAKRNGRNQYSI